MACKLLRIQREVLATRCRCGYRLEIGDIVRTAKFSSADTESADESGFLARSDLFHFDTDTEFLGEHLDELSEVDTSIRDIIENCLGAVALELHITDFHVKTKFHGNLAGANHRFLLARDGFLPFFNIQRLRLPVDFLEFRICRVNAFAFHLPSDYRAFQGHDSQVVAALCFDDHKVAHLDALSGGIGIDAFTGILEPDFEQVGVLPLGNAFQPVIVFELAAAAPVRAVQLIVFVTRYRAAPKAVKLYIFVVVHPTYILTNRRFTMFVKTIF